MLEFAGGFQPAGAFMCIVYAIRSKRSQRIYIGQSEKLEIRLAWHNFGKVASTMTDRPWELIAMQECMDRNEARWVERQLKRSRGRRLKWLDKYAI
jgi:putative endonuclease